MEDYNKGDWLVWYGDVCQAMENTHGKGNFKTDRHNGSTPYHYINKCDTERTLNGFWVLRMARPEEIIAELKRREALGRKTVFGEINKVYLLNSFYFMADYLSDLSNIVSDTVQHFEAKYGVEMSSELVQVVRDTAEEFIKSLERDNELQREEEIREFNAERMRGLHYGCSSR